MTDTSVCLDRPVKNLQWTQPTKTTDPAPISSTVTKQAREEASVSDLSATQALINSLRTPGKSQTATPQLLVSTPTLSI